MKLAGRINWFSRTLSPASNGAEATDDLLTRSRPIRNRILTGEPLTEDERFALEDLLVHVAALAVEDGLTLPGLTKRMERLVEATTDTASGVTLPPSLAM